MQKLFHSGMFRGALIATMCAATAGLAQSEGEAAQTGCLTEEQLALVGEDVDAAQAILPEQSRIIAPDSAVTQDYRTDRVNVNLDEDGIIVRVWCG
ncbi:I78 family peptidase inhibitor [Sedimentitalea todarodis]|uniref:I78 family peptidase inhibitor n=1 Tax=Sedimentitalea todarodis TaxID=1631240 RepID=A0ABU3VAI6_9RHOB|nr:I78 family peptidase inhibitor [Sedimentitalea todarodis]MDU9003177.1 I78 family peptidase inhibitor [Sedimentitalea todarodis]